MKRQCVERELTIVGPAQKPPRKGARSVSVNLAESPLSWQYGAGERLRVDYEMAQMAPSITMRWDAVRISGTGERGLTGTERQVAARARFHAAVDAAGKGLADILWRVVCAGESLPMAEKALAWPVRSGKLVLGIALDRVADFYRIG